MSDAESREALAERVAALEATVAELREAVTTATNRDLPLLKGTLRALAEEEVESLDELPDVGRALNDRLDAYDERLAAVEHRLAALGDVGTETSSKEEKIAAVLAFAMHKRNGRSRVTVSPTEIKGCTGVSRRYAYDLLEAIAAEVDGVRLRESRQVETGSGTERQGKALLVDCERVHNDRAGVNQFTTGEGVADKS
ncbi:MAG: hypothetical protein V5A27_03210 [Halapricum sp.]